ncbi:MAG: ROK family protein [Bacteroidota bacterium]
MANKALWGIDLGGTKIEVVVMEYLDPHAVLLRDRIPTEAAKGYAHILSQIHTLIENASQKIGVRPSVIGIGTPGAMDPYSGTMKNSNTTVLNGKPFRPDLAEKLGIPVHMANDANCFALAEARMGAVAQNVPNAKVVFGIIMGTGVGGGVVYKGEVWNGNQGIGGEWGHNFLHESGGQCYCGKVGCVETVISGTGLQKYYKQQTGEFRKLKEILKRHEQGIDEYATATIERLITYFGIGVSSIINLLDPDVIVIGGGVGNIDLLYDEGLRSIEKYVFNPKLRTPVIKPLLGDSAGVFGAAALVEGI